MGATAEFIRYLEKNGMAKLDVKGGTPRQFWNCFKIQKYVFLAKEFGLRVPHRHDVMSYGPYSTSLARQYNRLADNPREYEKADGVLDGGFDEEGFRRAVDGRNHKWLETAVTLIAINKYGWSDREAIVDQIAYVTESGRRYISGVLSELEGMGLVRLNS